MAGMFYSLKEVVQKLGKTEDEVKEIVKAGRLREFRDGPNLLFKVDEVESLLSDTGIMAEKGAAAAGQKTDEEEILLVSDTPEAPEESEATALSKTPAAESELSDADTMMANEGVDVLGETDRDYKLSDDTKGETQAAAEEVELAASGSDEASLAEIEGDVSLDSFGSGSGLLDLSLQADDTSLGGILDEIYTSEGKVAAGAEAGEAGSPADVAVEAEQMFPESAQPSMEAAVMAQAYVEPAPDTTSNILGVMLFLPLLVVIYTAIVAVAGFSGTMPVILKSVQEMIWYIMAGAAVVAGIGAGVAFMGGSSGTKTVKKPVEKKEEKPKKEKKAKKVKAGKDAQPEA
jgi:hypothetical protein